MNLLSILLITIISLVNSTIVIHKEWEEFKAQHQKNYKSTTEEKARFMIFQENLIKILEHNKQFQQGLVSYKMGINKFADLTPNEFKAILNLNKVSARKSRSANQLFRKPLNVDLPKEINWNEMGAVTPVKDQGFCGSCWSFSATGAMEGQYYLKNKKLVSLSEQNLIDCSTSYGNYGCNGGLMDSAFQYVHDNGITTEENYPYEAKDDVCRSNKSTNILSIAGFTDIKEGSEEDLMAAVATIGPVSVAIDASNLHLYSSGIFNDLKCSSTELNHGVLAVGYGQENGSEYWIIKNSWGLQFGEKGYLKMARNKGNRCGVATLASYPNL